MFLDKYLLLIDDNKYTYILQYYIRYLIRKVVRCEKKNKE